MINVTIDNFDAEVVTASHTVPVLVTFWSAGEQTCTSFIPLLEKLEPQYTGGAKLVTVNADEQPELNQAFGIRSIPTCVLLRNGRPVDGFMGASNEELMKEFFAKHQIEGDVLEADITSSEISDAPDANDPAVIRQVLHQAMLIAPEDDEARFAYIKLLLLTGNLDDLDAAKVAFAPVIAKASHVRKLDALQRWMNAIDFAAERVDVTGAIATFDAQIAVSKRDFDARFAKAQMLMATQSWTAAMDELLEILMRDKTWASDLARKTYIAILDIIEPPPVKVADGHIPPVDATVATYRRRLSSVVLS